MALIPQAATRKPAAASSPFFYHVTGHSAQRVVRSTRSAARTRCYNAGMTLVDVTYQLQEPLQPEQLRMLGQFANVYGLRRLRVNPERNQISLEYDASRLKETEVAQALRSAQIAVGVRV